jgi:hypothetical protein
MRAFVAVATCFLLSCALVVAQPKSKPVYPKKSGIYAMTPQGPVELTVSGERNNIELGLNLECFFSAESFDKIPKAESVNSFYVSAMGWSARRVILVVGRDALVKSYDRYPLFNGTVENRGVVAFEVFAPDLRSPDFMRSAIRKLTPAGVAPSEVEAYVVLELKSSAGMNGRSYPIRVSVPPQ